MNHHETCAYWVNQQCDRDCCTAKRFFGEEGRIRVAAEILFGLAWYHEARDENICYVGRYDAHGNREVLGRGRDWQTALDRAGQTLESLRNFQIEGN